MSAITGKLLCAVSRYLPVAEPHLAGGQAVHSAENVQKRGFPRAGLTDDDAYLALSDTEGNVMKSRDLHLSRFIYLSDIFKSYIAVHSSFFSD